MSVCSSQNDNRTNRGNRESSKYYNLFKAEEENAIKDCCIYADEYNNVTVHNKVQHKTIYVEQKRVKHTYSPQ